MGNYAKFSVNKSIKQDKYLMFEIKVINPCVTGVYNGSGPPARGRGLKEKRARYIRYVMLDRFFIL